MFTKNLQAPQKRLVASDGQILDVHSIFFTIQGEGPFSGRAAIFIRLAGCNLQCPACDTEYTGGIGELHVRDIKVAVYNALPVKNLSYKKPIIVITGGEPFRQNITPLTDKFRSYGYTVQVETNGTMPPSKCLSDDVVIVCSPKTHKLNAKMLERANHFKYVLSADSVNPVDGLPILALDNKATPYVARPPVFFTGNVYIQPMDCKNNDVNKANLKAVTESCKKYGYIAQLQIHKYMEIE